MLRRRFTQLLTGSVAVAFGSGLAACTYPEYYPQDLNYGYYYYPNVNVYFHIDTGYFYYRTGSAWHRSRSLPRHIHLDRRHRRRLSIREPRPYDRNREHRRRYDRDGDGRDTRRGEPRARPRVGEPSPEPTPRRRIPDKPRPEPRRPSEWIKPRRDQAGPGEPKRREVRPEGMDGRQNAPIRPDPPAKERQREAEERVRRRDRQERESIRGERRRRPRWLEQD
jgi:hypothetical protein